jgi:hypothetical protein
MKAMLITVAMLVLASAAPAQVTNCHLIRTGTFTYEADGATVIVKRSEKYQWETAPGFKGKFRIRWESPCTYVLYGGKVKGIDKALIANQIVRVEVVAIHDDRYETIVTSNLNDKQDPLVIYMVKQ